MTTTSTETYLRQRIANMKVLVAKTRKMDERLNRDKKRPARIAKLQVQLKRSRKVTMMLTVAFLTVVPMGSLILVQDYGLVDPSVVSGFLGMIVDFVVQK
jgi:hypothetical protein